MILHTALTTIGVLLGLLAVAVPIALTAWLTHDLVRWTLIPRLRAWRSRQRLRT